MALSTQTAVSDGTLVLLDISIAYLDRTEISVYFDSVPTLDWAWVGTTDKQITFTPAVPAGVVVLVKRTTSLADLRHKFSLGAAFTAQYLDDALRQVLHISQEATEANFSGDFYANIDMHANRIINVADAINPTDVPNLGQLLGYDAAAAASAVEAAGYAALAADNSRLAVGSVITGPAGSGAVVSITGLPGEQLVSFTIPRGDVGYGVAIGGTAGQFLMKVDATNYNTSWATLTKTTVGLSNVDNTSDANKPISTAQAAGLVGKDSSTGAAHMPAGTEAQRPVSPVVGDMRYNSTLNTFEGYSVSGWGALGGGATGAPGNNVFVENDTNVTADYTITAGKNAMSAGPITIDTGVTVTVPTGSVWTIV